MSSEPTDAGRASVPAGAGPVRLQAKSGGAPGPLRLVLATANAHKADEIEAIVATEAGGWIELLPRPSGVPDVEETGSTFEANARLKARALVTATGVPALADDSGLEVDALGGAPGVLSARYAGAGASDADNVELLLAELRYQGALLPAQRRARFRAVVLVAFPDGDEVVGEGSVEGTIVMAPHGAGGFGYDPVFAPDGADGRTFAELDPQDKHRRSHRGRALRALVVGLSAKRVRSLGD